MSIARKKETEVTGIGAAIAAGLKVGFWSNVEEIEAKLQDDQVFEPKMSDEARSRKYKRWTQAVERSLGFGWDDQTDYDK